MEIKRVRKKSVAGGGDFEFAEVTGTGDADHASWWTFDDEQEIRDRWWYPQPGETVLDIGAAFGSYALPALARGARVVCFSPCEFDTQLLKINLDLNPKFSSRCLVVRDGLYSKTGYFNPDASTFSETKTGAGQELAVRTLDSFLDEHPGIDAIDWIKMDVEGAELEVLRGAVKTLKLDRPKILVENHNFFHKTMEKDVVDFLVGLGVGYRFQGPYQHCAVSHTYFECRG